LHPVWSRYHIATDTCPKSYVTATSLGWIEEFLVWRRLGYRRVEKLSARDVEAFMILENELTAEQRRGRE
jgi:hypothetical protein